MKKKQIFYKISGPMTEYIFFYKKYMLPWSTINVSKGGSKTFYKKIKEVQGHTPMEVIVGIILGFFIGVGFSVL